MVNIAKTKCGKKIRTLDIITGIVISKEYYCMYCGLRMVYVKEGSNKRSSHFRHKSEEEKIECDAYKYGSESKEDKENEYHNEMSDFHTNWQSIFDGDNLEHRIVENGKVHFTDIYIDTKDQNIIITTNDDESIFTNFSPTSLVIEVQHSTITYDKLIERTNFYHNQGVSREIMWVFDLKGQCVIEKIVTFYETKYRIRLRNHNSHDFQQLFKIREYKPLLFLDNGGENIYYVRDIPILDQDYLDVIPIKRDKILNDMSPYVGKKLVWTAKIKPDEIDAYEYQSVIDSIPISEDRKNVLRYIFYILEYAKSYHIKERYMLREELYKWLMVQSYSNSKIKELFRRYLKAHRTFYNDKIQIGSQEGKKFYECEYSALKSVYDSMKLEDIYYNVEYKGALLSDMVSYYHSNKSIQDNIKGKRDMYFNLYKYIKDLNEYYEGRTIKVSDYTNHQVFYQYIYNVFNIQLYNIDNGMNLKYCIDDKDDLYSGLSIDKAHVIMKRCVRSKGTGISECAFCKEDASLRKVCSKYVNICEKCYNLSTDTLQVMVRDEQIYIEKKKIRLEKERERLEEERAKKQLQEHMERVKKEENRRRELKEREERYMKEQEEKEKREKREREEKEELYRQYKIEESRRHNEIKMMSTEDMMMRPINEVYEAEREEMSKNKLIMNTCLECVKCNLCKLGGHPKGADNCTVNVECSFCMEDVIPTKVCNTYMSICKACYRLNSTKLKAMKLPENESMYLDRKKVRDKNKMIVNDCRCIIDGPYDYSFSSVECFYCKKDTCSMHIGFTKAAICGECYQKSADDLIEMKANEANYIEAKKKIVLEEKRKMEEEKNEKDRKRSLIKRVCKIVVFSSRKIECVFCKGQEKPTKISYNFYTICEGCYDKDSSELELALKSEEGGRE